MRTPVCLSLSSSWVIYHRRQSHPNVNADNVKFGAILPNTRDVDGKHTEEKTCFPSYRFCIRGHSRDHTRFPPVPALRFSEK